VIGEKSLLNRRSYGSVMWDRVVGGRNIAMGVAGYMYLRQCGGEFYDLQCATLNLEKKVPRSRKLIKPNSKKRSVLLRR
jgi:hypothetical protein